LRNNRKIVSFVHRTSGKQEDSSDFQRISNHSAMLYDKHSVMLSDFPEPSGFPELLWTKTDYFCIIPQILTIF